MLHHPLPYDDGEDEKILGPLTLAQTGWLGGGMFIASQFAKFRLPIPGMLGYIHLLIPIIPAVVMAFFMVNNMPIAQYLSLWYDCRKRKRVFIYKGAK
ncbi:MAG: PrgI family mobile element protein [Dethiobacteraceae bacterium]|jgi:hypothetical protein